MRLTVLIDNNTLIDRYFTGEPGLSIHISDGDSRILFDTGYSDALIRNACKMGLNLANLDYLVLSHGHVDHTGGLSAVARLHMENSFEGRPHRRPVLVAHPDIFVSRHVPGVDEIGSLMSQQKAGRFFDLSLTRKPLWISERLVFLGEIGKAAGFEGRHPLGRLIGPEVNEDDYLIDDSALAYKTSQGLVIITGCSHAGICNIVEHARQVCGEERVVDIIGGLHLLDAAEEELSQIRDYLKALNLRALHPCHCTDLAAKMALSGAAALKEVGVGLVLDFD